MTRRRVALLALSLMSSAVSITHAQERGEGLNLALPTENDALFNGGGADFYQHILRDFKGEVSRPWQGGQYGFVRNPQETGAGLIYTRFHEGLEDRCFNENAGPSDA